MRLPSFQILSVSKAIIVVELIRHPGVVCFADWISNLTLSYVEAKLEHTTICFGTRRRLYRIYLMQSFLSRNVNFNLKVICFRGGLVSFQEADLMEMWFLYVARQCSAINSFQAYKKDEV